MPVRHRETGQVRVVGIVIFMLSKFVYVCVQFALFLLALFFLQRMFDVRSKMEKEEKKTLDDKKKSNVG